MPTFTAVVASHAFERGLRHILGNLRYQTHPPDETIVCHSGYDPPVIARLLEEFDGIWVAMEDRKDWGHEKRAHGLSLATCDYVGFFNDDDRYHPEYVEKMLAVGGPVAYCRWNLGDCHFQACSSTSGNFIVDTKLAQEVGWKSRDYVADAHFISAIAERVTAIKVDEELYEWNALSRDS